MPVLAVEILSSMQNIAHYRVPATGLFTTDTQNWDLIPDLDKQVPALHEFIRGNDTEDFISLPEEPVESSYDSSSEVSIDISFLSDPSDIIDSQVSYDISGGE